MRFNVKKESSGALFCQCIQIHAFLISFTVITE